MSDYRKIEGDLQARGLRFGIVIGRFNSFIGEQLLQGSVDCIVRHGGGAASIDVVYVPGAYEIPLAARAMAAKKKYDAIIALGAVIRGGTPHFEYVAGECSRGLAQVSQQFDIPLGFGVLTVDTIEQAIERAGTKSGNKGAEATMAAIEMANLMKQLRS